MSDPRIMERFGGKGLTWSPYRLRRCNFFFVRLFCCDGDGGNDSDKDDNDKLSSSSTISLFDGNDSDKDANDKLSSSSTIIVSSVDESSLVSIVVKSITCATLFLFDGDDTNDGNGRFLELGGILFSVYHSSGFFVFGFGFFGYGFVWLLPIV